MKARFFACAGGLALFIVLMLLPFSINHPALMDNWQPTLKEHVVDCSDRADIRMLCAAGGVCTITTHDLRYNGFPIAHTVVVPSKDDRCPAAFSSTHHQSVAIDIAINALIAAGVSFIIFHFSKRTRNTNLRNAPTRS